MDIKLEEAYDNSVRVVDSKANNYSLDSQNLKVLIPSMGGNSSRAVVSGLKYSGINAEAAPPPGEAELKRGRANSSSKECLSLQLTLGTMLNYLDKRKNKEEILVYFMPEASGLCRFGQYNVLLNNLIEDKKLKDIAVLTFKKVTQK